MLKRLGVLLCVCLTLVGKLTAQSADSVFVQIEAKRSLLEATQAALDWSARLQDVNGFALQSGWYGIALGPYARPDAEQVLRVYKAEGIIPSDSYLAFPRQYGPQFFPVGANVLGRAVVPAPVTPVAPDTPVVEAPRIPAEPADETPRQARASERNLSADARKELQIALEWSGVYKGAIDGAFGRGTRRAMADWQLLNNFEQTGILTSNQRRELIAQYNAVLEGLDLTEIRDEQAGISMKIPTAAVKYTRHTAPFVQFDANGAVPEARVILISQPGTQTTLFGLYEIMQTLEIVPLDGPRERRSASFSITGENRRIVSETRVALQNGNIKGFTLVWPKGDEARRTRLLAEMEKSFVRLAGVLPQELVLDDTPEIDLGEGLNIRAPRVSRTGFFVDSAGSVVTTSEAVAQCSRLTLDGEIDAELVFDARAEGIAILRPSTPLSPMAVARFSAGKPRRSSEVAVAGFSFEGVLDAASMTFGSISAFEGLRGEPGLNRLAMSVLPGDAGGPVLDAGGGVLGMLLPRETGNRALPDDVNFAADAEAIQDVLLAAGMAGALTDSTEPIDPVDLTAAAQGMSVLVSCWD